MRCLNASGWRGGELSEWVRSGRQLGQLNADGAARRQEDCQCTEGNGMTCISALNSLTFLQRKGERAHSCIICAAILQLPALASKILQRCRRR